MIESVIKNFNLPVFLWKNGRSSNLDLYQIRCEGNDDTSFSIHIIGREDVDKEIKWLKNCINLKTKDCQKRKYFFTN